MNLFQIRDRVRPFSNQEAALDWILEREALTESISEAGVLACWLLEEDGWVCDAQMAHTLNRPTPAHLHPQTRTNPDLF